MADNDEQRIARGQRAKAMLQDDVFREAVATVRAQFRKTWEASYPDQEEDRERMYYGLQGLALVEKSLQNFVDDATIAVNEAEKRQQREKQKR